MQQALLWAAAGTGFTFSMTALGAAMVFFMKKQSTALMQRIFLGFAAGVMIAASVWSLLIPAIEETEQAGGVGWLPASGGFLLGILLMLLLDGLLPHLHNGAARAEGLPSSFRRTTLLVLAVTLHNIPEGMAVGLSFARAAQHGGEYCQREMCPLVIKYGSGGGGTGAVPMRSMRLSLIFMRSGKMDLM